MRSKNESAKVEVSNPSRIGQFFRDIKEEINLISWPNRDEVVKSTITVLTTSIIVAILVFGADQLFTVGLKQFLLK
jgi:preprotein translocase SecE subunit